jgi:uncharacterized protein YbjT (DUF2867 family)
MRIPKLKIILFGASGMVGQGVLRECLLDPEVESVLAVLRSPLGQTYRKDKKLREIIHSDFTDFSAIESQWPGYHACFFCLGVSSIGMSEKDYAHVTKDFTLAAAESLSRVNPGMTFIYVSGAGTDSSERGRVMWARVKGETENRLLQMPFKAAYMFRPGFIQPLHGIRSKTKLYRILYLLMAPFTPLLKALFPKYITTTEQVGRAMIRIAKKSAPKRQLENIDINAL